MSGMGRIYGTVDHRPPGFLVRIFGSCLEIGQDIPKVDDRGFAGWETVAVRRLRH